MTSKLAMTLHLMMVNEPKEEVNTWDNKDGTSVSRVREYLQGYLLGTENPHTLVDIDINKFSNGSQFRNVKLTELYKMFIKNEDDLTVGRKIILAEVELLPVKSNFASSQGNITSFRPFLTGFTVAEPTEKDLAEIETINRVYADTSTEAPATEETAVA